MNGNDPRGLDSCTDKNGKPIKQGYAKDCSIALAKVIASIWPFSTPEESGWSTHLGSRGGGSPGGSRIPGFGRGGSGTGNSSQSSQPMPSCRSAEFTGLSGRISIQTNSAGYVAWGIYMRNPILNWGQWQASIYVGTRKVDGKNQFYPPHGSVNPVNAKSGSVFRIEAVHTDIFGHQHTSVPNACIIP